MFRVFVLIAFAAFSFSSLHAADRVDCDLLVVGGNESGVAAAVQACRLGVKRVVLVNDIDWLGGQFSSQGVGAVDEWTTVDGKRTEFPRSGLFLEVVKAIEESNRNNYGTAQPGNCFCARLTVEPKVAARIFEDLVKPYVKTGQLTIARGWETSSVVREGKRVVGARFQKEKETWEVVARLTIDASDWGDVIRLSETKWSAGPDAKARFEEPSAPQKITEENRREMNPLTYCITLRGGAKEAMALPEGYDAKRYFGVSRETAKEFDAVGWPKGVLRMNVPAFADTIHKDGPYSPPVNVYTHRRLVDAVHLKRNFAEECLFLNWPVQDYPLDHWPQRVIDELEATEKGASKKNIVELTTAQRRIVLADAKRHSLGLFYHLRTVEPKFRGLQVADDFGTPDLLPPHPYIREGLRLEALTMLREQDLRTPHSEPKWAKFMPADGVFGFQFNIDFHPTRRQFLKNDPAGPWATIHTATRNWSTHTDRSTFPLRGLIPVETDGLLGASRNIGVSSIVSSALRLHGQMMLCGQASATVAALALKYDVPPRKLADDPQRIEEVQRLLVTGRDGPGVILWPYHDLAPDHPAFAAANLLSLKGIWRPDADSVLFHPEKAMSQQEWTNVLDRLPEIARKQLPEVPPATRASAILRIANAMKMQ